MQKATGTKSEITYTRRRQGATTKCVEMRPILEVCAREMGYEGGDHRRDVWWLQEAVDTQLAYKQRVRDSGMETGDTQVDG